MMKKFIAGLAALSFSLLLHAACSTSIGKATINELAVTSSTNYLEIARLNPTTNITGWKVYICDGKPNGCSTINLSDATTVYTDTLTNRTYYVLDIGNSGKINEYQAVLLNGSNNTVDFLNATRFNTYTEFTAAGYTTSCTFSYDTTATPDSDHKLIYRGSDGTGNWELADKSGNASDYITPGGSNNNNPGCTVPDYNLSKTVDNATPFIGSNINYTITIKNKGCLPTVNATLTDTFPSTYLSTSSPTSWTITPLAYNTTQTFTIPATANSGSGATIVNSANVSISSENTNTITDNNASVNIYPISPLADYHFDECSWNGTTGEVLDSTLNGYNATAKKGGATTTAAGKVCRASSLDGNSYLQIKSSFLNLTTNFTVMGWFKTTSNTIQGQRIFIDDERNTNGYGLSVNDAGTHYVRFYHRGQNNEGIIDATAAPISADQWYFAAAVADTTNMQRHLYVFNSSGTLLDHKSMAISGSLGTDSGLASMGGETDLGETSNRFKGYQDEIKVFKSALTQTQLQSIVTQELLGNNYNGTSRTCDTCGVIPLPVSSLFDAWDNFRSISDRNISTKIVNKPFDLNISSLESTNTALQDFNGTVCARIVNSTGAAISGWNKLLFNAEKSKITTFTPTRAIGGSDNARIDLHWKTNANADCPLISETNTTMASDRFSIRPASFAFSAPNAVAGVDFNITFTAPIFGAATASTDFNESAGSTFDVTYAEHNVSCPIGTFNPALANGWSFANGSKLLTTRYNEVGVIDLNISDAAKACDSRYTNIDCDDANVSDGINYTANLLPIGATQAQITITPHHFDLNATLANTGGGAFTYLSMDMNMSATLDLNVSAKNGEGNTTKNYDKGCYAKSTTITLPHSLVPSPLTKILYFENLSGLDGNISKDSNVTLSFPKTIFTQGVAPLSVDLNFDRNSSKPLNPFDFNFTNATITDTDSVMGSGVPLGTATFVYGRVRAYDIKTDQFSAPNPIEIEIYSTLSSGYVSGMPQNILKWYRNLNHNSALSAITAGDDCPTTTKTGTSSTITINTTVSPENGLHPIQINNNDAISNAIIHLGVPSWLWYSSANNYDFNTGTNCTQHPCFDYQFFGTTSVSGVSSGTFGGSDFTIENAKTTIKRGVKVFR